MIERQRAAARPVPEPVHSRDPAAVLDDADVSAAIAGGRKIEAIKLVRERTGLGLAEAKELVEQAR
ncbi:ribosomal protein L7/L12 [Qipengyuania sp. GH29]|nr:ribosomal protein L7/L12 [Qipengyuania sphaerica]